MCCAFCLHKKETHFQFIIISSSSSCSSPCDERSAGGQKHFSETSSLTLPPIERRRRWRSRELYRHLWQRGPTTRDALCVFQRCLTLKAAGKTREDEDEDEDEARGEDARLRAHRLRFLHFRRRRRWWRRRRRIIRPQSLLKKRRYNGWRNSLSLKTSVHLQKTFARKRNR